MFDVALDPNLIQYANRMTGGELLADALNKAILLVRTLAVALAPVESGETKAVFQVVSLATPTNLEGGVGQMARVGDPFESAPKGTISAFLEWYHNNA